MLSAIELIWRSDCIAWEFGVWCVRVNILGSTFKWSKPAVSVRAEEEVRCISAASTTATHISTKCCSASHPTVQLQTTISWTYGLLWCTFLLPCNTVPARYMLWPFVHPSVCQYHKTDHVKTQMFQSRSDLKFLACNGDTVNWSRWNWVWRSTP